MGDFEILPMCVLAEFWKSLYYVLIKENNYLKNEYQRCLPHILTVYMFWPVLQLPAMRCQHVCVTSRWHIWMARSQQTHHQARVSPVAAVLHMLGAWWCALKDHLICFKTSLVWMDCGGVQHQWVKICIAVWIKVNAPGVESSQVCWGIPTQTENIQVVVLNTVIKS